MRPSSYRCRGAGSTDCYCTSFTKLRDWPPVSLWFSDPTTDSWRGACEGSCQLWRWGPKTQKWRKRVRRRRRVMSHPIKSTKLQLCRPASRKRWKQIRNQRRGIVIFTSDGSGRIWPSNWIKLISIEPLDWESEAAFSSNLVKIWIMNRQLFLSFWKDANWKLIWKCKYWVIWYARAVEHLCKTWWSIFFSTAKYLFNTCRDIFMFRTQFHDTWCSLNFVKHKLHFQVLLYYHLLTIFFEYFFWKLAQQYRKGKDKTDTIYTPVCLLPILKYFHPIVFPYFWLWMIGAISGLSSVPMRRDC